MRVDNDYSSRRKERVREEGSKEAGAAIVEQGAAKFAEATTAVGKREGAVGTRIRENVMIRVLLIVIITSAGRLQL